MSVFLGHWILLCRVPDCQNSLLRHNSRDILTETHWNLWQYIKSKNNSSPLCSKHVPILWFERETQIMKIRDIHSVTARLFSIKFRNQPNIWTPTWVQDRPPKKKVITNLLSQQITVSDITKENVCKCYNVGYCKYNDECMFFSIYWRLWKKM